MAARYVQLLHQLRRDEGQDLIEYGLLAALIAVALVAILTVLGQSLFPWYSYVVSELAGVL